MLAAGLALIDGLLVVAAPRVRPTPEMVAAATA
jgi:hypothetical protein